MKMRRQAGIAMVEVMVAVVILAVGLIGAFGMQIRSYAALADSGNRSEATLAAEKLIGLMTVDQANLAAYALAPPAVPSSKLLPWYTETLARIPGASVRVDVAPAANTDGTRVVVTITWTRKAGTAPSTHRLAAYLANAT